MGTFSGPEAGTSTIEKRQRSIKMKETLTVKLQMELQRYASQKKVLQEILLVVGKDIQKDFTKIYEILESLEFGLSAFSDVCFRGKGSLEVTIQVP